MAHRLVGKGARHFEEPRAPLCREAGEGKLGQEASDQGLGFRRSHSDNPGEAYGSESDK